MLVSGWPTAACPMEKTRNAERISAFSIAIQNMTVTKFTAKKAVNPNY